MTKVDFNIKRVIIVAMSGGEELMALREINNGVKCISNNFIYSCPLKLDDDYKKIILGLFYHDYDMHFGNLFKSRSILKQFPNIKDEISAGRFVADYGYVTFEFKDCYSNIFVPEFFNKFQFTNMLDEIAKRDNYIFSLYNQFNGYNNDLAQVTSNDAAEFIKSIYSDLCYDASKDFIGYSLDRKAKAIKRMK